MWAPRQVHMNIPEGWTDDLNIEIGRGRSVEELVDHVIEAAIRRDPAVELRDRLVMELGLSESDAELAIDRALGGVVRAATGNAENCPKREKDPVAWTSYQKCVRSPELIGRVYPQFKEVPRKPWWRRLLS